VISPGAFVHLPEETAGLIFGPLHRRLEPGYKLIIGGIDIPHTVGCVAHSDG